MRKDVRQVPVDDRRGKLPAHAGGLRDVHGPSGLARRLLLALFLPVFLAACGGGGGNSLNLMPSPEIYTVAEVDPYPDEGSRQLVQTSPLFYVTDREPAGPGDTVPHYTSERGLLLRAGTADVSLSPEVQSWDEIRAVTLSKERPRQYRLALEGVSELGPLPTDGAEFLDNPPSAGEMAANGRAFAQKINAQLAASGSRDIFIYIHGYKNAFERPILVSRELQHFLGYRGAFISFGWPATPSNLAYFKDLETANATVRNLRQLLGYLSDNTKARKIHLLGYSAGSRLAFEATYQIALTKKSGRRSNIRLGQVILVGSDIDPSYFGQALADGLLEVPDQFTVYSSGKDSALGLASFVFARPNLGQIWSGADLNPVLSRTLTDLSNLSLIDVTDAEASTSGNGHGYFRSSPWVSSDIFLSLLYQRPPGERGLEREGGNPVWQFPEDYPQRLAAAAREAR